MFVQIKKEKYIRQKDIVGVFELDTSTVSALTKSFLSKAEKSGKVVGLEKLPKSFVLECGKTGTAVYFSASLTARIAAKSKTAFINN